MVELRRFWDVLRHDVYEKPRTVFRNRTKRIVDLSPMGMIVRDSLACIPIIRPNVVVDERVVMPNHVHLIIMIRTRQAARSVHCTPGRDARFARLYPRDGTCAEPGAIPSIVTMNGDCRPRLQRGSLGAIIGQFKSVCTKRILAVGFDDFAWQSRYHDVIIRNHENLERIRTYIRENPMKWESDVMYIKEKATCVNTCAHPAAPPHPA
ncbi:MAG: hypothetical protein Greene041619_211 [Candidatus Peregrinibacteria bacterium Greene0416_19]|nr:MAG: hypothetical protein Greene041619_211 [Candidatus Peregrinibacteria bacterium Greene0416_19]